jgi:plasmid stability protein
MLAWTRMNKNVQIRDVPEDVHRELKSRAAAAGQSLSEYLLAEITRVAERPPIADVLRRADSRREGVSVREIVAAVRSGRDRA